MPNHYVGDLLHTMGMSGLSTLKSIANNPEFREGMPREHIDAAIARHADQETLYD